MKQFVGGLVALCLAGHACGEEYGRGSFDAAGATTDSGAGRATLPAPAHGLDFLGGTWGLKLGVGWAKANWNIGQIDGYDSTFAPSASLFYKPTDRLDVNLSGLFLNAEDEAGDGTTKAEMARLAVGLRYWPFGDSRINPHLGFGIGYYLLGGKTENADISGNGQVASGTLELDDVPGAYLEGGIAWQITDNLFINTDLSYDLLLSSPSATIGSEETDFDVDALSVNLGATFIF